MKEGTELEAGCEGVRANEVGSEMEERVGGEREIMTKREIDTEEKIST